MKKGFSLIELIIYIAVSSIMLVAIVSFVFVILQSRTRNFVINEVEDQGRKTADTIVRNIHNAESVDLPSIEGIISDITNPNLLVSNSLVEDIARPNTPGLISFQFTLSYNNPGKSEYNYSKIFYGSASLR